MNTRLQQFLTAENITQSQFAESIGVAPASISHILAGRNKPGFDFISNMAKRYPSLNIEWLITGKGKMYKADNSSESPQTERHPRQQVIFEPEALQDAQDSPAQKEENEKKQSETSAPQTAKPAATTLLNMMQSIGNQRKVCKIVIFFDDNTFQEFV